MEELNPLHTLCLLLLNFSSPGHHWGWCGSGIRGGRGDQGELFFYFIVISPTCFVYRLINIRIRSFTAFSGVDWNWICLNRRKFCILVCGLEETTFLKIPPCFVNASLFFLLFKQPKRFKTVFALNVCFPEFPFTLELFCLVLFSWKRKTKKGKLFLNPEKLLLLLWHCF